ncbi:MAG: hypothetical protein V3R29_09475 [Candidatus Acidoferrales bacterium]
MNKKQLIVLWLLAPPMAAWLAFSFLYAARHVEEPGLWQRTRARVSREGPPEPGVRYDFVWERDAGTFFMLALPGLIIGVPLILTLGRKK